MDLMNSNIQFDPNDEQQAFKLGGGKFYLAIQTCDDGYDYTIYCKDFSEYDGGQLDEPEMTMEEAIQTILESFELNELPRVRCDYDDLTESVMQVEMAQFDKIMANRQPDLVDRIIAAEEKKGVLYKPKVNKQPQRE